MKDLKHEGKQIKSELKAGQDQNRGNQPKQPGGAYNPQQKQPLNNTNKPLPGKENIGGIGNTPKNPNVGTGKGFEKDKDKWK